MKTVQHLSLAAAATLSALASLSAQATDVVVYGRLNATFENVRVENGHSRNVVNDNASRIGFRGTEDLGGGKAVIFQIESRVRVDGSDSGTTLASRDSWVGLRTPQGTLRLGRTLGPIYYATYDHISMHNHDTGYSSDALLSSAILGNSNAAGGRMNNTIWYTSPKIADFTLEAAYALLDEAPVASGSKRTPHHLGLVANYDRGPLHAAVSYASTQNTTDLDSAAPIRFNNDRAVTAGGSYNFGPLVVGALFERSKRSTLTEDLTRNYWRVALMAPVGAHEFHLNVGAAGDYSGTNDTAGKQYTVAYNYNLSKRSKVYAYYTKIDNDSARSAGGGGGAYSFLGSPAGLDISSVALGIRHNF